METDYDDNIEMLVHSEYNLREEELNCLLTSEKDKCITAISEIIKAVEQGKVKLTDKQLDRLAYTLAQLYFLRNKYKASFCCFHGIMMAFSKSEITFDQNAFLTE